MAATDCIDEVIFTSGLDSQFTGIWRGIEYGWADYIYHGTVLAKYIFTFTNAAQWNELYDRQVDFVSEIIEPVYFQQANDISWNLYWVAVLAEDELKQLDLQKRLIFSSNTEFTRNLVVSLEQLPNYVPVGHISVSQTVENLVQPVDIWTEALEQEDLTFCLEEYNTKTLNHYIEGLVSPARKRSLSKGDETQQRIQNIREITVPRKFRPHYYPKDWNISLRPVNILYGPNGTGKTSLLSAVEAVLTGEADYSGSKTKFEPDSGLQLLLETDRGELVVRPAKDNAEKKRREHRWYRNRGGNRTRQQLNEVFHRFNYFTAEETFLFSTEQRDYRDIFTKILYGPSTNEIWRNRTRYLEECVKYDTELKKESRSLKEKLDSLTQVRPVDRLTLNTILSSSGLSINPDLPPEDILKIAQSVLTEYEKVQGIRPVLSKQQTEDKISALEEKLQKERTQRDSLKEEYARSQEKSKRMQEEKTALERRLRQLNEQVSTIEALEPTKQQLAFYIDHRGEIDSYKAAQAQKLSIKRQLFDLELLMADYSDILSNPPELSLGETQRHIEELQSRQSELRKMQDSLTLKLQSEELLADQWSQTMASLRASGLRFYELDPDRDTCPLCGTEGVSKTVLLAYMERNQALQQGSLIQLRQELDQIHSALTSTEAEYKAITKQLELASKFDQASKEVLTQVPTLKNPADIFSFVDNIKSDYDKYVRAESELKATLLPQAMRQLGTDEIADIDNVRETLLEFLSSCNITVHENVSEPELLNLLKHQRSQLNDDISATQEALLAVQDYLQDDFPLFIQKQYLDAEEQVSEIENELSEQKQIRAFWSKIQFALQEPDISAISLKSVCESVIKTVKNILDYDAYIEKQNQYSAKMQDIRRKQKRCKLLRHTLESLQPPEDYAEQFIQHNIAQISQIFGSLHQPQEFSALKIDEKMGIVGCRGEEIIPVSQMSTGQRTALVLSVFFQMNLTAGYTPAFLLLDEPVANIDDLNILALIDFLREFVITHHRQIIATTANRNVAKLFRRKFSFLLEDFQELSFYREKELQLRIVKRCYSQQNTIDSQEL